MRNQQPVSQEKPTAVEKSLLLLELIGARASQGALRLTDIVEESGFSKPTAHRLLGLLRQRGYVVLDEENHRYELGPKLLVLGAQYRSGLDLEAKARPLLRRLAEEIGATAHLAIRDGASAVYIDKVESNQSIRLASAVGHRMTLYSSAMGKVLLAHGEPALFQTVVAVGLQPRTDHTITQPERLDRELQEVRAQGYAVDEQENELGIRCVAAPLRDHRGEVVAAISVSGTLSQVPRDSLDERIQLLVRTAGAISQALGYSAPSR